MQHYYLFATMLYFKQGDMKGNCPLNILLTLDEPLITQSDLAKVQQKAQVRYYSERDKNGKSTVTDVFIMNFSYCGHMEAAQFHKGFEKQLAEGAQSEEPDQETLAALGAKDEPAASPVARDGFPY